MDLSSLLDIAERERQSRAPLQVRCCVAAGCESAGSQEVLTRLQEGVEREGLQDRVPMAGVGCMRLCARGPLVRVEPDQQLFQNVTAKTAPSIIAGLKGGTVEADRGDLNSPLFKRQSSVVLENSGAIEPERVESYIAAGDIRRFTTHCAK